MVARSLNHGLDTTIANTEPVARLPRREEFSGSSSIQARVADNNRILGLEHAVRLGLARRPGAVGELEGFGLVEVAQRSEESERIGADLIVHIHSANCSYAFGELFRVREARLRVGV